MRIILSALTIVGLAIPAYTFQAPYAQDQPKAEKKGGSRKDKKKDQKNDPKKDEQKGKDAKKKKK